MSRTAPLLLALLGACAADPTEVVGQGLLFRLSLDLARFGDPAVDLAGTTLSLRRGEETFDLGTPGDDGTWTWPDVEPLAGDRITLAWSRDGALVARAVTAPIDAVEGEPATTAWVLPAGAPVAAADLSGLPDARGAAAAVTPDGALWLVGGAAGAPGDDVGTEGRTSIVRVDRGAAPLAPQAVGTPAPPRGSADPRLRAGAVGLAVDGASKVLVAGGRRFADTFQPTASVYRWDTATGAVDWWIPWEDGRSEHVLVALDPTRVLAIGGYGTTLPGDLRWDVIDGVAGTVAAQPSAPGLGGWAPAWVALPDGVAVCGGARAEVGLNDIVGATGCAVLRPGASPPIGPLAGLPEARVGAAMGAHPDGTLILVGGVEGPLPAATAAPATDTIWRLPPGGSTWVPAGTLTHARVHHALVPLAPGRWLVVGGVDATGGLPTQALGAAPPAAEVLDLFGDTVTATPVPDSGSLGGAWPAVARAPGDLTVIVEGTYVLDGATAGGTALWLVDDDPALTDRASR